MTNTKILQLLEKETSKPNRSRFRNIPIMFWIARVGYAVLAVWAALTIVFVLLHLSGDPAISLAPETASNEEIERLREQLGFKEPLYAQYIKFMGQLLQGSFPSSLYSGQSAMDVVLARLPNSLILGGLGVLVGSIIGLSVGFYSVYGKSKRFSSVVLNVTMVFQAMPNFLIAILLLLIFSINLGWLPTSGQESDLGLILPVFAVGFGLAPNIARLFRTSLIDQRIRDYVTTARVKGINERVIQLKHVVPNSLVPVITLIGLQTGALLGGIVIIETIFGWPGVGRLLIRSVNMQDFPVVISAVTIISISYVILSLVVDVIVSLLTPKGSANAK